MSGPPSPLLCQQAGPECPVQLSLLGSYPNLGGNVFFCVMFGLLFLAQLAIGIRKRTWTFMVGVSLGCLDEMIGYIGRLLIRQNPFGIASNGINIFCLVIGPSFIAAGVYLTLKHVVIFCGPEYSRIRPKWYPWIFILCDVASILIQAIGGAIGAGATSGENQSILQTGEALIITGIVLQVVTMSVFGLLAVDYFLRRRSMARRGPSASVESSPERALKEMPAMGSVAYDPRKFRYFILAVTSAYVTILIRCIFRIVEMAGGWGGPIMKDETLFLVLDGTMVLWAALALTFAHPGFLFQPMCKA